MSNDFGFFGTEFLCRNLQLLKHCLIFYLGLLSLQRLIFVPQDASSDDDDEEEDDDDSSSDDNDSLAAAHAAAIGHSPRPIHIRPNAKEDHDRKEFSLSSGSEAVDVNGKVDAGGEGEETGQPIKV